MASHNDTVWRSRMNCEAAMVMSRKQRGEAMIAVKLVILLIAMAGSGHMGVMGHGHDGNRQDGAAERASTPQAEPPPAKSAPGHQH